MAIYAIPDSSIVNKLNIMSYSSACTIRTIMVTVIDSIYSQSVRESVMVHCIRSVLYIYKLLL